MKTQILSACLLTLMTAANAAEGSREKIEPTQMWTGSAEGEPKDGGLPIVIKDAKAFAAAWKHCERTDAVPEIDWTKNIAVLVATKGSRMNLAAVIDGTGNLVTNGIATRDFRPGHRYALGIFPRAKVKSVNGEKL